MGIEKIRQRLRRSLVIDRSRGDLSNGFPAPSVSITAQGGVEKRKQVPRRPLMINGGVGNLSDGFPAPALGYSPPPVTLPSFAIQSGTVQHNEGNTGVTAYSFIVTRSQITTGTDTVNWAVTGFGSNPAAASDFQGGAFPSGVLTFSPGDVTKTITVNVAGDATVETDEEFRVTISGQSSGTISSASCIGQIVNDDTSGGFAVLGSLDPAQFGVAYSDSLSASGGTGPYTVSGLPAYGLASNVSGGTITFSGTPS